MHTEIMVHVLGNYTQIMLHAYAQIMLHVYTHIMLHAYQTDIYYCIAVTNELLTIIIFCSCENQSLKYQYT